MAKKHRLAAGLALLVSLTAVPSEAAADILPENLRIESYLTEERAEKPRTAADEEEPELLYDYIPVPEFRVSGLIPGRTDGYDYTDWWYCEWNDCRYLFLPATADRKKLKIEFETVGDAVLTLNGEEFVSGKQTSLLNSSDEFDIEVDGEDCGKLIVMQSNLGAIYLETDSGTIEYLDRHRKFEETGTVLMVDETGAPVYSGSIEKLSSHGNSSWDYSDKKSYNLKLPAKANLYGMGKAKKWVLLSNFLDFSMLRNWASQEISKAAGMVNTLDSTFVDLYANGSYRGTYQLSEKAQIQKNRINIRDLEEETENLNDKPLDEYNVIAAGAYPNEYKAASWKAFDIPNNPEDITGGYLLEFQKANRYPSKAKSGFVTKRGQAVTVKSPEYCSSEQIMYLYLLVQEMEDAVYSDTGINKKGKHYTDYMDMDSLIASFLIQEFSMNIDGTTTSFYLWKDSDETGDGKFHFEPAWDFDFAYCNYSSSRKNGLGEVCGTGETNKLFLPCFPIDCTDSKGVEHEAAPVGWLGMLYKKEDNFKNLVAQTYYDKVMPYVKQLTDPDAAGGGLLMQKAQSIRPSAEMNSLRWHMFGHNRKWHKFGPNQGETFWDICTWLRDKFMIKRDDGLRGLWTELIDMKPGDVNADTFNDLADAVLLSRMLAEDKKLDIKESQLTAADINGDGFLRMDDLTAYLEKIG